MSSKYSLSGLFCLTLLVHVGLVFDNTLQLRAENLKQFKLGSNCSWPLVLCDRFLCLLPVYVLKTPTNLVKASLRWR